MGNLSYPRACLLRFPLSTFWAGGLSRSAAWVPVADGPSPFYGYSIYEAFSGQMIGFPLVGQAVSMRQETTPRRGANDRRYAWSRVLPASAIAPVPALRGVSLLETKVPRPALGRCRASDRLTGPAACGRAMPTVQDDRLQRGMRRRPARQRARHADCLGAGHRLDFSANFRHAQRPESVGSRKQGDSLAQRALVQVECHPRPSRPRPASNSYDFVGEKAAGEKPQRGIARRVLAARYPGCPGRGHRKPAEAGTVRIASHAPSRATPRPHPA